MTLASKRIPKEFLTVTLIFPSLFGEKLASIFFMVIKLGVAILKICSTLR